MTSFAGSLFMLLLVLAAIPATLWAMKRMQNLRIGNGPRPMEVTAQLSLGARERVVMVRVDERVLVLGVTSQQVTLLVEHGQAWLQAHAQ